MNQIAVDMHILHEVAPVLKKTFNLNTNLPGTIDTWAVGFVDELDYISEAEMQNISLKASNQHP